MSLPHSVLRKLSGILDGAAVHNWKRLVEQLPEYTQTEAMMFATEEQQVRDSKILFSRSNTSPIQGRSPTMAIMSELDSRGWSVVDLAHLAHKARLGIVVDIIKDHCRGKKVRILRVCDSSTLPSAQGWSLPLPPPSTLHSAKQCKRRPSSPPEPTPPTTPTARKEALVRYSPAFASTPGIPALASASSSFPQILHEFYQLDHSNTIYTSQRRLNLCNWLLSVYPIRLLSMQLLASLPYLSVKAATNWEKEDLGRYSTAPYPFLQTRTKWRLQ